MNPGGEHLLPYQKSMVLGLLCDDEVIARVLDTKVRELQLSVDGDDITYQSPERNIVVTLVEDEGQTLIRWQGSPEAPENFVRRLLQELELVSTDKGLPLYVWGVALVAVVLLILVWLYLPGIPGA